MKKLSLAFIAFVLLASTQCTPAIDKEIKELDAVLMEGHDNVMPKSMNIGDLKDDVLSKAAEGDSSLKSQAASIANNLQIAEDAMYKWMDDYSVAMNDEQDKNKKLEMYKGLKTEIDKIAADTDNAIKAAKVFTGKE